MRSAQLTEWASCGRLDKPPHEHCYVRFPESFGRRFMIFVDTEEEFDWGKPFDRDNRSTAAMRSMPRMHDRMRSAGATPIYLIDHPIASDPDSVAILKPWLERGECAIGAQLHPWVNPPFEEDVTVFNSFTGNLPVELQRAKLQVLTETIAETFGARPTVYRAGRYGVGEHTAQLLVDSGYKMDVSVRALFDYSAERGPNFDRVRPQPFWIGDGGLLEVPLSASYTGRLWRSGARLARRARRIPKARHLMAKTGLLSRVALTPEEMPLPDALAAASNLLEQGTQILSISFHSPSVEPGHTPYVRTQQDLHAFYRWWDGMFDFLDRHGVAPVTVEEVLAAAEQTRSR